MVSNRLQDIRRTVRLLYRHIRFFRPWQRENRARLKALAVLFTVTNRYLRKMGVDYWLAYGTLLGYHRERRILPHDTDIDFGAHKKAFDRIWKERKNLPPGFTMYDTSYRHHGPKLYIAYQGWEADIYFYEDTGSQLRPYERSRFPGESTPFPRDYVYPLEPATFLGTKTRVPSQARALLVHHYRYIGANAVRDKKTGYWHPKQGTGAGI